METFSNKEVLITGGLGFIGSNLAARLLDLGARVTLVDSLIPEYGGNLRNIEPFKDRLIVNIADIRDHHALKVLLKGKDFLFNLAGQTSHLDSMNNPFPDLEINSRAQLYILEACRQHNKDIKIVFAGTRQVYGKPQYLPVNEAHPIVPVDVNGINKMSGEWYHLLYNNVYGIRTSVLRLTNTFGPRMRVVDARQTFLGIWIKSAIEGQAFKIFGDGKQVRDYNYIDDVVEAFLLAAASDKANGEIFNLGSEERLSLQDTADIICGLQAGASYQFVEFPSDRKAIDIGDFYADYSKIKAELGFKAKVSFESGMRTTLDYYRREKQFYW